MPPKFNRYVEGSDRHAAERVRLLDDDDDDDNDFFLKGPTAKPGRLKNDSISRVQGQVDEVVGVMQQNIGKVLDRGEKLEDLHDKSEDLSSNAHLFRSRAKGLQRQMWWKQCRMRIILALVIIAVLLVIIIPIIVQFTKKN